MTQENTGHWIIDENGNEKEVGLREWAEWIEKGTNRRIAYTEVGPFFVSTVFLGLDHSFGIGAPLLYETMAFEREDSDLEVPGYTSPDGTVRPPRTVKTKRSLDGYGDRYSTREEALAGHERTVNALKNHGTEEAESEEGV